MKKFSALLVALAAVLSISAFAACTPNSQINGNTDPDDIQSDKITQAEWTQAFSDSSFTNYTAKGVMTQSDNPQIVQQFVMKYAENGSTTLVDMTEQEVNNSEVANSYNTFYEKTGSTIYAYEYEEGKWVKSEISYIPSDALDIYRNVLADGFSQLEYSEKDNAYVAEQFTAVSGSSYTMQLTSVSVKFANKKIAHIQFDMPIYSDSEEGTVATASSITATISILFYDYGTTQVTLPNAADNGGNGEAANTITEAQWREAFSEETLKNYTLTGELEVSYTPSGASEPVISSQTLLQQFDITEDHDYRYLKQTQTSPEPVEMEYYTSKTDGVTTVYTKMSDGTWEISTRTSDLIGEGFTIFADSYADAQFDSETSTYILRDFSPSDSSAIFNYVYLRFEGNRCVYMQLVVDGLVASDTTGTATNTYYMTYGTANITLPSAN